MRFSAGWMLSLKPSISALMMLISAKTYENIEALRAKSMRIKSIDLCTYAVVCWERTMHNIASRIVQRVCLSVCLSVLSVCRSQSVCHCQSVSMSVSLCVCLSSVCLYVCVSVCLSQSVCLSVSSTLCNVELCWHSYVTSAWTQAVSRQPYGPDFQVHIKLVRLRFGFCCRKVLTSVNSVFNL